MNNFNPRFFQPFSYTPEQIQQYFENAEKDFTIAQESSVPDIIYRFCYDAALKLGIALIAKKGHKARSIPGHHEKILEQLGALLEAKDHVIYLQRVRRKRNTDLYLGGVDFTDKEAKDLLKIVKEMFQLQQRL